MSKGEYGFTIVELLVTIVVSGFVIVAIASLFIANENGQRSAQLLEAATRAGDQEIEALRNNNYNSLTAGTNINFTSSLPSVLPAPKTGTVAVSEPNTGVKRVDITITYKDGSAIKTVKLSSLIGQIGIGR